MKKVLFFAILLSAGTATAQNYSDVAPIFYSRCTSCHHDNAHAPSFMTYSQVEPHTSTMKIYLNTGYMPPWQPDTTYSRFSHERIITPAEKSAIINWINAGAKKGDTTLAPKPPVYTQYQLYGTPDLELSIPTFTSNASTDDSYVCFSLPSGLTQDRIVRAYEIVPGNVEIVHHVIANVDTLGTSTSDLSGGCYSATGDFSLGGYAPGAPPTVFPSTGQLKMGIKVKAGSKIVLQIHYPIGTAGQTDNTKIRIYFYPVGETGVRPVYVTTPLQNWLLNIPAGTVKTFTAKYPTTTATLPYTMSIFAAFPHSHVLATYMLNCAYLGTDTIPLIKIKNWDFNWQGYYTFRHLTKVPTGYKLFSKHVYDNTTANPNLTGPPVNTVAGTSTSDEMLFDSFQWLVYQTGDEKINIDSLLAFDPLLSSPQTNINLNDFKTYAYPNPFKNSVRIGYDINSPSKVTVEVYTIFGTRVNVLVNSFEAPGTHELIWDGKNSQGVKLASGTYIYIVKVGDKQSYGKLNLISGKD